MGKAKETNYFLIWLVVGGIVGCFVSTIGGAAGFFFMLVLGGIIGGMIDYDMHH